MGHMQTTAVVVSIGDTNTVLSPTKLATVYDSNLGAYHFDLEIFNYLNAKCKSATGEEVIIDSYTIKYITHIYDD